MAPTATDEPSHQPLWADRDALRTDFTLAMSAMYKAEVPLYGDLVRIVGDVNHSTLHTNPLDPKVLNMRYGTSCSSPSSSSTPTRLDIERHGAIRLGTPDELRTIRRIFALIGLHPVGYYDLSPAGLPMHATCFRPRHHSSLARNPFRVFTSVLRPSLLRSPRARDLSLSLLRRRSIFSPELLHLLDLADSQSGRLTPTQGVVFVREAMRTFGWHSTAAATHDEYTCLQAEHPILADIACFRSSHINHLTPRTLDISAAQERMKTQGLKVKDRIEGPPPRACPILLRQTSFLAIEEAIEFLSAGGAPGSPLVSGSHRARFGEIEERGAAVTPRGRKLYDELLDEAMAAAKASAEPVSGNEMDRLVVSSFEKYPDDWDELRRQGLIYCSYRCTDKGVNAQLDAKTYGLEKLVEDGMLEAVPLTYEDFLPLSAAGIFQSNLGSASPSGAGETSPDVEGMEEALGTKLEDADELYRRMQSESIDECASKLGIYIGH